MKIFNQTTVSGFLLALLFSLVASSPAPTGRTPAAATLAARATVALEKPQFPRVSRNFLSVKPLSVSPKKKKKKHIVLLPPPFLVYEMKYQSLSLSPTTKDGGYLWNLEALLYGVHKDSLRQDGDETPLPQENLLWCRPGGNGPGDMLSQRRHFRAKLRKPNPAA